MNTLAPIVLFVYNRPWHTEQTLFALMHNELADQSVLYIYADGRKENATEEQLKTIESVRQLIRRKKWCKEVHIIEAEKNKGLADSIIDGVTEIVNKYGKIIVLEDDIVTSKGFLNYMNDALDVYENEERVFHISGYMFPNKSKLPTTFFYNVPLCWGWATWKRAWNYFKGNTIVLVNYFNTHARWDEFNRFGGSFLEDQLRGNLSGKFKTWFIKWHASVMIQNGFCLFPRDSLVNNIGFDNTGVHNETTEMFFHSKLAKIISVKKIPLRASLKAERIVIDFYRQLQGTSYSFTWKHRLKNQIMRTLPFKQPARRLVRKIILKSVPEIGSIKNKKSNLSSSESKIIIDNTAKIYDPYQFNEAQIGAYTYVSQNSFISQASIGKFCSIGPNFLCGWGIHPTNGISTSPMFYSTQQQNGITFSLTDKVEERKDILIGNDVFIGANVTILDGITIGDGAVIGAGAVVSKNIPAYAIAAGNPIRVIRYRFNDEQITKLLKIKWWDFDVQELNNIEKYFFDVEEFIKKYTSA